ncbi:MAG TPA: AAA family ATPase, partial [Burkholderiaceae bacterium]|nr:AAA family ATPase [Burkholderiaceae bacterium]
FDPVTGAERPERVVDQVVVDGLLGGVDEQRFRMMHGLGSEQLRIGGRELLNSGSELGAALFEAASGVQRLRAVAAGLQAEAEAIFVPRGQKRRLNEVLGEFEARQEEARAAGLRPRDWQARRDALAAAQAEASRLEAVLRERRERLAHVERLLGLGPQVGRLEALGRRLASLAGSPELPPDAAERLAAWRLALQAAGQELADAQDRARANRDALAAIRVSQPHLDAAAPIAQLAGRLEEFEAARLALPAEEAEARAARGGLLRAIAAVAGADGSVAGSDVSAGLANAATSGPADTATSAAGVAAAPVPGGTGPAGGASDELVERARAWLPSRATVAEARQQLAERRALAGRRTDARAVLVRADEALADAEAAWRGAAEVADLSGVEAAHDASVAAGDLEHRATSLQARLESADAQLARLAAALGGPDPETLARRERVPAAEADRAETARRELETARAALAARRAEPGSTLPALVAERAALAGARALVDRDALRDARRRRDARLDALRGAPPAPEALGALADGIVEADRLADARFDDASRIAGIEALSHRIDAISAALAGFDEEAARLDAAGARQARQWSARLAAAGMPAMEPAAYRDWAARHDRFLEAVQAREALAAEHRAARLDVERHRELLHAAYRSAGLEAPALPTLAAALAHARRLIDAARRDAAERARLRERLDRAVRERDRARAALAELDASIVAGEPAWARVAAALRLDASAAPGRVEARLDEFDGLRDALAAWESAERRLQVAGARIELFRTDAAALARRLGVPAPAPGDEAAFVAGARAALAEAERARDERIRLRADAASLDAAISGAARRRDEAQAGLALLREQAGAADLASLEAAIERSQARREAAGEAERLEAMVRASTGPAHDALVAQATSADPASLEAERTALRHAIAEAEAARDAALAERTRAQQAFDAIDGDNAAARAHEAVRERLAASARLAVDWARLRLARALLDEAVQRHQQRAQGPLLAAAARWFARVTGGRWRDLRTDWDGDLQVLVAERADGERLRIERLSEGTADALYLALRLAAIEVRLGAAPPVPLLLDDVLMTFDDERAGLALQGLAELGERNQVVYFTHHAHLVELARRVVPAHRLAVRELIRGPAAVESPRAAA